MQGEDEAEDVEGSSLFLNFSCKGCWICHDARRKEEENLAFGIFLKSHEKNDDEKKKSLTREVEGGKKIKKVKMKKETSDEEGEG